MPSADPRGRTGRRIAGVLRGCPVPTTPCERRKERHRRCVRCRVSWAVAIAPGNSWASLQIMLKGAYSGQQWGSQGSWDEDAWFSWATPRDLCGNSEVTRVPNLGIDVMRCVGIVSWHKFLTPPKLCPRWRRCSAVLESVAQEQQRLRQALSVDPALYSSCSWNCFPKLTIRWFLKP